MKNIPEIKDNDEGHQGADDKIFAHRRGFLSFPSIRHPGPENGRDRPASLSRVAWGWSIMVSPLLWRTDLPSF